MKSTLLHGLFMLLCLALSNISIHAQNGYTTPVQNGSGVYYFQTGAESSGCSDICGDGLDNDNDCLVDCADNDCGVANFEFSNGQNADWVIGQTNFTANGFGNGNDKFRFPKDIAYDPTSTKVFVADWLNHRVLRFGSIDDFLYNGIAEAVFGQPNFTTTTSGIAADKMNLPIGIYVDSNGRLWVADSFNNRVLRFDNAATKASASAADGVLGQTNFTSNASSLSQSTMNEPSNVHVDASGNLYVIDRNNRRVLRFDGAAAMANGANASGVLGQDDYTTNIAGLAQNKIGGSCYDLQIICNSLFVSDFAQNRIMRWDSPEVKPNGANADAVLGQANFVTGTAGTSQTKLDGPQYMTADKYGTLYVSEQDNSRVVAYKNAVTLFGEEPMDLVLAAPDFATVSSGTSQNNCVAPDGVVIIDNNKRTYLAIVDRGAHRVVVHGNENITVAQGNSVASTLPGLDPSGSGSLTFALISQPSAGTVVLDNSSTGAFTYTAPSVCDFNSDSIVTFDFTISNANGCSETAELAIYIENALDVTPPTMVCQDIDVYVDATGNASIVAADIDNGSTDNCGIVSQSLDITDFDCSDLGPNNVVLTGSDAAGNDNTCTAIVTVIDTINPVLVCQNTTAYLDGTGNVTIFSPAVTSSVSDNCGSVPVSLSQNSFDCSNIGTPVSITVTATDASSNSVQCAAQVTVVDTISPVVSCQNINVYLDASGNASIAASDIDNGSTDNCGAPSLGININSFDCSNVGTPVSVILTATDASSNSSQCTATVTVLDTISPTAICQDINVYLDASGNASIVASDVDNGSGDNCSASPSLSIDISSFNCSNLGTPVNVTLTVNDGGQTQNCVSSVTVLDTISPVAVCQNINVVLDASGNATIVAADVDNGSSDNCSTPILSIDVATFDCTDIGAPVNVVLTATDASGNTNTCVAQVNVLDSTDPTAVCQNINAYLDASGNVIVDPADVDNGSSDNCGTPGFSLSTSTFDCEDLGPNAVIFTATDASGNDASCPAVITVIDTVSPVASCTGAIILSLGSGGSVSITGADLDLGSTDNCAIASLDANPNTFTSTGNFTSWLIVTDGSGNVDSCSVSIGVIDDTEPVAVCQDINAYLDASGNVVIASADVDGGSTDNGTIASIIASDTTFTCADLGANAVNLVVTDNAANDDTCTAIVTVLDTIAPVMLCQDISVYLNAGGAASILASDVDNGSSDNCAITSLALDITSFNCLNLGTPVTVTLTGSDASGNSNTCTATVTVLDTISPTAVCQDISVYLNAGGTVNIAAADINNGSSDNCGVSQLTIDVSSFDCSDIGTPAVVTLTATDDSGNTNTCTANVTVLDTISPSAVCQDIDVYLDATGNATIVAADVDNGSGDNCTTTPNLSLDITAFDCSNLGTPVNVVLTANDGSNSATCSAQVTVLDTVSPVVVCQDITVYVDAAGNASIVAADIDNGSSDNCGAPALSIDVSSFDCSNLGAPVSVTLTAVDASSNSASCSAQVTVLDTITPTVLCQDINVYLDGAGNASILPSDIDNGSADNCGTPTLSLDVSAFDCSNVGSSSTVTLTGTDGVNSASCIASVTILDTIAPVAICSATTVSLDGTGTASITPAQVDGGSTDNCSIASSTVTPNTFSGTGVYAVTLVVTDPSGNQDSCTVNVTVDDSNSPVAVCQDINAYLDASGNVVIASADVDGGSTDNGVIVSIIASDTTFACADTGANNIALVVTDNSGNDDTCFATVTVLDTISPVMVCQDINVYLNAGGAASILASDIDNGSSDNCAIASLALDITSFDCSNIGTPVTVTLTGTDGSANSATCTATVTVLDTITPTALCQDINVYLDGSGNASIVASDVDNGSGDNCTSTPSLSIDISTFDCSNLAAAVPVTLTVNDGANSQSCIASVTVLDTISPTVVCQDITVYLDGSGNANIAAADVDNGSSDNCGAPTLALDITAFDCSNTGAPVVVTLTATDGSANSSSCTANVTVLDTISPVASCQDITVYLDQFGLASILPADVDNGSSDNCGTPSFAVDISSFSCTNLGTPVAVTLTVSDAAGNSVQCVSQVTVLDTVSPGAFCQDINVYLDASGNASINPSDIDNGSGDNCGAMPTLSVDINSFDCNDIASPVTVTLSVDDGNNITTCQSAVTVLDTISPTVVCQDITVYVDGAGNASIVAADIDNGSSDNCASPTLSIDINSFDCSNIGTPVSVTLTATDASSNTSTCTASVTVVDTISPTALCQDINAYLDATGNVTITAADIDNGSSDNCGLASLAIDISSFDCSDVGSPATVTLTVTDANSNSSTCTATVTVLDTISPAALCQDISVYLDASGNAIIAASDIDNGSGDNCSVTPPVLSIDINSFDCSDVGSPVTVTLTVNDGTNSSTCQSTVTVLDTISPIVVCQDITVYVDGSGNASIGAADVDNGSSDNCTTPALSLDLTTFNCSTLGINTVTLTANDGNGNTASCNANVTVLDTIAPTAVCVTDTISLDGFGNATLLPSSIDGGSSDNCAVDNLTLSQSLFTAIGTYPVTLYATDPSGNIDSCTVNIEVVDNNAPTALCNDTTLYLDASGNASLNSIDLDGGSTDNGVIVSILASDTTFDCTQLGTNNVILTVTDDGNNSSQCSATVTVLDSIAPVAVCVTDTISLDGSGVANLLPGNVDGGSSDNCTVQSLTVSPNSFNAIGTYNIWLVATDQSGNVDSTSCVVEVVDNNAPTAICSDTTLYLDASGNAGINSIHLDGGSTDNGVIVSILASDTTFDCSETGVNTIVLTVTDDGGNSSQCTATVTVLDTISPTVTCQDIDVYLDASGAASISASDVNVTSGDNCANTTLGIDVSTFNCADAGNAVTVTLTATDDSGNTSTCTSSVTVLDTISPTVICQTDTLNLGGSGTVTVTTNDVNNGSFDNCSAVYTISGQNTFTAIGTYPITLVGTDPSGNQDSCTVNIEVVDNNAPIAACNDTILYLDNNGNATINSIDLDSGSTDNVAIVSILANDTVFDCTQLGTNTVTLTVTDNGGNTDNCTATVTVLDTIAPLAVCLTDTFNLGGGTVTIPATAIDGGSTDNCTVQSLQMLPTNTYNATGTYSVQLVVTDQSGNTDTCTTNIVIVDVSGPTALCSDTTLYLDATGSLITLTSQDLDGGSFDNSGTITYLASDTTFDCSNSLSNPTQVVLTITDMSGNSDQCIANVTVLDTISPIITCQNDTIISTATGTCGAVVNYSLPSVSDNCAGAGAVLTSGLATGSSFPTGVSTITYEATDAAGNTSTCSFTVTVVDNEAPVAVCQADTLTLNSNGFAILSAGDIDGGSTDNCGIDNSVIDTSFFTAPGSYPVQLIVFDAQGNSDTCSTIVVVNDTLGPTALCNDTTLYLDALGSAITLTSLDLDGGSFDNGSTIKVLASDTVFDCSDAFAPVNVVLEVTDAGGNIDQCTAIVTVLDTIQPQIACQADTIYLDQTGSMPVNPLAMATVTDNCASPSLTANVNSVSCADIGTPVNVTLTASDSQNSVTCSTTVTVLDTISPTVLCMNDTVLLDLNGIATISTANVDAGTADNCTVQTLSLSQTTFTSLGTFPVTLTATDQSGNVDSCVALITVIPTNSPPVILDDLGNNTDTIFVSTIEDVSLLVCPNAVDPDIDPLDVTSFFNGPSNGLMTGINDGDTCFTYTPFSGFIGIDYVTIVVCDTVPLCDTVVVAITVNPFLEPPVAVDDTISVDQGATVDIDNLANDFDPDGDPFTTSAASASNGIVTINSDGSLTYTPDPDFCGTAYIDYSICDTTGLCDIGLIEVTVNCDDLIIPQGFSPDGDLIADTWVIEGLENYPNNKIKIFNRWGNEVFAAGPYQNDWDGNSQGSLTWKGALPEGTYYFILELNDEEEPITGFVYLKRQN